jgi:hypothetical protein
MNGVGDSWGACQGFYAWSVPQPPGPVAAGTGINVTIQGTETCSNTGTTFKAQATCSSSLDVVSGACSGMGDNCLSAPCGSAPAHASGPPTPPGASYSLAVWDRNDLHAGTSWTFACNPGDSVILTHLDKTGSGGDGCTFNFHFTGVSASYCSY